MHDDKMLILRVEKTDDTRIDGTGDTLGRGVKLPDGLCVLSWNLEAFPPESRLDNPHQSLYGSVEDLEQGTGGKVIVETEV